jgi:hypothetical protein
MTEIPGTYRDSSGKPFTQKPSEVEAATKLVIEALGSFHWRSDYFKFCEVLGFTPDSYAEEKYSRFQELISNLNQFDSEMLTKMIESGGSK